MRNAYISTQDMTAAAAEAHRVYKINAIKAALQQALQRNGQHARTPHFVHDVSGSALLLDWRKSTN